MKRALRVWLSVCLVVSIFATVKAEPAAASTTCGSGGGYTVTPSHGNVFYIDTGVTPKLDAGYIGYRVTNGSGSTQSSLWTQVSNFTGGKVSLNNPADAAMQLPTLANGASGMSYFMLKATGASTAAQTHTVKVFDRRPDLAGATALYTCTFTFAKVQETIKAAANKVADNGLTSAAAIEVSDTSPELGQLLNITVEGQTGQIGSGSTPDFDIIWLTPAAVSTWPTRALRLESVSITFDGNANWGNTGDQVTYTNQLLITGTNGLTNVDTSEYRITYSFRVVGQPTSSVQVVPVAQIASGTQVKHSDIGATGATLSISFSSLAVNATLTKSVTSSTGLTVHTCGASCTAVPGGTNGMTYVAVPYRLTASTTSTSTLTMEEIVDTPATGIIYKPGSATVTDITGTRAVTDPIYIDSESALNPRPYHFTGPFTINNGTSASLDYSMWVPVGSYANTAYGKIGDLKIGATQSAMSRVTITSIGTSSVVVVVDTVSLGVSAITDPATDITTTAATLNGTVDPNGATLLTGQFEWGTSPSLAGATVTTATTPSGGTLNLLTDPTPVSLGLTGLSSATTYYYRVIAGSAQGSILSFTTTAVQTAPTVVTLSASGTSATGGTLNGTINPNLTPVTGIQFIYGTSPTLASGNTTLTEDDGTGLAALTANGSSEQAFDEAVTGLSAGTTYYYKIRACTSALTGTYPTSSTCASFVDGAIVSFVAASAPSVTTVAATSITSSSANLNGTVNANGATATNTFEYGTVSDLSSGTTIVTYGPLISGASATNTSVAVATLSASTTYYFRAIAVNSSGTTTGSILNFTTSAAGLSARTLAIDGGSYTSTYSTTATPPTITSTASAGVGTKAYSSSTTGVCTINASTGLVAFVTAGTCTIGATIASDGTYQSATATAVSFTVTLAPRTHAIDAGSYNPSYTMVNTPPTITSTPSSGTGTKAYSSTTTGVCTINASTGLVAFVSAGTCTIGSTVASDGTYQSATASNISFSLGLAPRTIAIDGSSYNATYSATATPPTITSTASAGGGTKTYTSSTTGVCTINASTGVVTFVSAGTCSISVSIASDGTYAAAVSSSVSFSITSAARTLTIDSGSYTSSYLLTAAPPTITSTASSGTGTKAYSSSTTGVCTINASTGLVAFVTAGTCTIGATIAGDGTYQSATATSVSFAVTSPTRTLTIDSGSYAASYLLNDAPPTITSTASSGTGTKAYSSSTTGVCTIAAATGVVTFVMSGTCTIGATIAGDGAYGSATAAAISFAITPTNGGGAPSSPPSSGPPSGTPPVVTPPPTPVAPPVEAPPVFTPSVEPPGFGPPAPQACDVCAHLRYDLYIINPDGTERHTGTPWVVVTDLGGGVSRYAFEDATIDPSNANFDHDDVVVEIDASDCGALKVRFRGSNAAWKHRILLKVFENGVERTDTLLAVDDDRVIGTTRTLDAKGGVVDLCLPPPDPSGSLAIGDFITVYEHIDYGGKSQSFAIGTSDADLSDDPIGTNTISSFRLFGKGIVRFFRDVAFGGVGQTFTQDDPDLRNNAIGQDTASSLRVTATTVVQGSATSTAAAPSGACFTAASFTRNLAFGSNGPDVLALQTFLRCLGHFPASTAPNGNYGPATRAAVTAFQAANGLPPLGIVGPRTRAALDRYLR